MKPLLLLIFITLPLSYLFGKDEYEKFERNAKISSAPAFAPAMIEDVVKTQGRMGYESYRVRFMYVVNGRKYSILTTSTDKKGALDYLSDRRLHQVAYFQNDPSVGTLKRYYDLRDPEGTLPQLLTVTTIGALLLALPIALGMSWRLGWLRRQRSA